MASAVCTGIAASYYYIHSRRVSTTTSEIKTGDVAAPSVRLPPLPQLDDSKGPEYDSETTKVVFVLGGPGVGKGTQCARLVRDYDFVHLSAGDLLREERQRPNSPYGDLIEYYIREGKIVPQEITISLLRNAMRGYTSKTRFLVDGFPRSIEQGIEFEMIVCPSAMVLFFECGEEEMLKRLMGRSQNSGRSDDNVESIKKRFRTYQMTTVPVREFYTDLGKLRSINSVGNVDEVYERTKQIINEFVQLN
jgi:UMP-CMP kinase